MAFSNGEEQGILFHPELFVELAAQQMVVAACVVQLALKAKRPPEGGGWVPYILALCIPATQLVGIAGWLPSWLVGACFSWLMVVKIVGRTMNRVCTNVAIDITSRGRNRTIDRVFAIMVMVVAYVLPVVWASVATALALSRGWFGSSEYSSTFGFYLFETSVYTTGPGLKT